MYEDEIEAGRVMRNATPHQSSSLLRVQPQDVRSVHRFLLPVFQEKALFSCARFISILLEISSCAGGEWRR